ncbi:MAG: redox-regulated ATPase YchF [Candidatus Nealsonbacteria bacterium]|nr:redox-regulated ATPase YchF [Candidatus Nealsonbacteria bacterium]
MSFRVGIVGLPNVGKSTLFKALTQRDVDIAPRPFTTINPNVGRVAVPDHRLEKISKIIDPEKTTPTTIEFVDIAGLVKGAHQGEGLGNQFLGHIRNCDAILEVVRLFENPEIENVLGEINPQKEIEVVGTELLMKDLETLENIISKLEKKQDKKTQEELDLLNKVKQEVSKEKMISELDLEDKDKEIIKQYQFLTAKPTLYVLNGENGSPSLPHKNSSSLVLDLKEEEEISELPEEDKKELGLESHLGKITVSCYDLLNLITFFTVAGKKEVRAWTATEGSNAPEAGGTVHSDFQDKFIRAEVIGWDKLVEIGSWTKAKEQGEVKTVGKDYIIHDGEVIEFKI